MTVIRAMHTGAPFLHVSFPEYSYGGFHHPPADQFVVCRYLCSRRLKLVRVQVYTNVGADTYSNRLHVYIQTYIYINT